MYTFFHILVCNVLELFRISIKGRCIQLVRNCSLVRARDLSLPVKPHPPGVVLSV